MCGHDISGFPCFEQIQKVFEAWISLPLPKSMAETSKEDDDRLRINRSTKFGKANGNVKEIEYNTFVQRSRPFAK